MDRILYPTRRPNPFPDAAMPVDYPLNVMLSQIFGAWSAVRVSRFLEVNPRTIQRWLKDGGPTLGSIDMPEELRQKIAAQHALVAEHKPMETIEDFVEEMRDAGIHDEVLASHLAVLYRRLTGRDIE
jgi:hypothetical protein